MKKYDRQNRTEERILANKIKQLEAELITLPAYARKQKTNKNFTAFLLLCLVGSLVFYVGVGMAVALSGLAFLTLIAVGYALFVPLILVPAIILVIVPIKKLYLWVQNLFSSEKIKAQNKDYDHLHNNLQRLKKLAAEKNDLSSKINLQLNKALQCLPSEFIAQAKVGFMQLSLKEQIQQLEQQEKKHPAYSRKQKIKANWGNLSLFSMLSMFFGAVLIYGRIILPLLLPTLLSGLPSLIVLSVAMALILIVPFLINGLYGTYLWTRNLFSSAEIKIENMQYTLLEKTIAELKKLEARHSQLDEEISNELEINHKLPPTANEEGMVKSLPDQLKDNKKLATNNNVVYGPFFNSAADKPMTPEFSVAQTPSEVSSNVR